MRRGFFRNRSGATALEFALVSPILIMGLIGVFNIGYGVYCGGTVRNAVERSARSLILDPSTPAATIEANAMDMLVAVPVDDLDLTITTEQIATDVQVRRVTWTYDFLLSVPLMSDMPISMGSSLVVPVVTS
jgi:Flp pilus assembly protein TadG